MSYGLRELYGIFFSNRVLDAKRGTNGLFRVYFFKEEKLKTRLISI